MSEYMTEENRLDFEKVLMLPDPGVAMHDVLEELKKCYEELDNLPARETLNEMHDYTKWLERVESYFLADGYFNHDADFVRMCAVNNKYGYRIEVIDGVETVVHESEW
tara:strand:+ start:458 stop:781 length:324 start_codon:yes stop_codon:yes gene_type:complete